MNRSSSEARSLTKARRMAEAVNNETLAERRARLLVNLGIAESLPVWAPQAEMLREALAELPPPGVCESWRWRDWRSLAEGSP